MLNERLGACRNYVNNALSTRGGQNFGGAVCIDLEKNLTEDIFMEHKACLI